MFAFGVYAISWTGEKGSGGGGHCNCSILRLWQRTKWEIIKDRNLVKKSVNAESLISASLLSSPREVIKGDTTQSSCLFAVTSSHRSVITKLRSTDHWWSRRSWKIIHVDNTAVVKFSFIRWMLRCLLLEKCVAGHERCWVTSCLMVQKFWKHPIPLEGRCLLRSPVALWQQHSPRLEPSQVLGFGLLFESSKNDIAHEVQLCILWMHVGGCVW